MKGLCLYIGAYKVLTRIIKSCSQLLSSIARKSSSDKIFWSDGLLSAFNKAKSALSTDKSIVLPKPTDQLWVVTDGAVKNHGLGATLYVSRGDSKPKLAGVFGAKLRGCQHSWIPCEVEVLSIATAVKHFNPYIIQSRLQACVLTDNKPCVQAYEKLSLGEFSTSARVSTFLTTVSRYQVSLCHLSGSANLPSDFTCRNAPDCDNLNCQVHSFVVQLEGSTANAISVQDVLSGSAKLAFTFHSTW